MSEFIHLQLTVVELEASHAVVDATTWAGRLVLLDGHYSAQAEANDKQRKNE